VTLLAEGVAPEELLDSFTAEVGAQLDADFAAIIGYEAADRCVRLTEWAAAGDFPDAPDRCTVSPGDPLDRVARTLRSVRLDGDEVDAAAGSGLLHHMRPETAIAVPIVVEGDIWGMIAAFGAQRRLAADVEAAAGTFAQVLAIALSGARAQAEVRRLADEQSALRRVATRVAQGASSEEVFALIVEEVSGLTGAADTRIVRHDGGDRVTVVAGRGVFESAIPPGRTVEVAPGTVGATVLRSGRAVRIDDVSGIGGPMGEQLRRHGLGAAAGAPLVVDGRVWGVIVIAVHAERMRPDTEHRLEAFCELATTAIASSEARQALRRLADEQAALRRVAVLVAQQADPADVFAKVAEELATLLDVDRTIVMRYDDDETAVALADWGAPAAAESSDYRVELAGDNVTGLVRRTGRSTRIDDYRDASGPIAERARAQGVARGMGAPIAVGGELWGAMLALSCSPDPLPLDLERRIEQFTELVATAIANAEARAEVTRLAEEQAALRRVATLVAEGSPPAVVFDAAIAEVGELLHCSHVVLVRFQSDAEVTVLARLGLRVEDVPPGARFPLEGNSATANVLQTGQPSRIDDSGHIDGRIGEITRGIGVATTVATPVFVEGRLWGSIVAGWVPDRPAPADAEQRLTQFAELLGVAIANADSHDKLTASRARIVAAQDDARRRVVRDLHDGAQQRLIHTIVTLRLAEQALGQDPERARELVAEALEHASLSNAELRDLAQGLLPPVLTRGGLRAGVESLVSRIELPVTLELPDERYAPGLEASAYFVIAEALTNVLKHAQASRAEVRVALDDGALVVSVRDDGIGGADPEGTGLLGIGDRVAALGGRLTIDSPANGGTLVEARLPVDG